MALKISGTAKEVAAYLASLGDDVEVTISTEPLAKPQSAKRGPGRPPSQPAKTSTETIGGDGCAVIGCSNTARSKGYCAAHYQKLRALTKSGRAEAFGWLEGASPQSVANPVLPRGRAAAAQPKSDDVNLDSVVKTLAVPPKIRRANVK